MKRSQFIKSTLMGAAGLLIPGRLLWSSARGSEALRLTVLHTNDTHSRIDPFPSGVERFGGLGGIARRATLVNRIREEESRLLLLDAGDIFQGTPYFNLYKGTLDLDLMSKLKYDASTLGNHDFDNGVDGFTEAQKHASFPFVNVNFDFTNTPLADTVQPYVIRELDGLKVGIFGVGIDFENLVTPELHRGVKYRDPVVVSRYISKSLRYYHKCHLVICLSHLGLDYRNSSRKRIDDISLAKELPDVDLIIGGHTHTFLDEPIPTIHEKRTTWISQVGFAGLVLGRLNFAFNDSGELLAVSTNNYTIDGKLDKA